MLRLLCCVILAVFIAGAIGCGGGAQKPPDLKQPPKVQATPPPTPKKQPTEDELWLSKTCGQCHTAQEEQRAKLEAAKTMTTDDLKKAFEEKMLPAAAGKPEITFTDAEVAKALELHTKMKEAMAQKG